MSRNFCSFGGGSCLKALSRGEYIYSRCDCRFDCRWLCAGIEPSWVGRSSWRLDSVRAVVSRRREFVGCEGGLRAVGCEV